MITLPEKIVFALILAGSMAWFAWRIGMLVRLVRMGKPDPDDRFGNPAGRVAGVFIDVFAQRRVFRKPFVGLFHLCIVWGFFVFAVNTVNHFAGAFFPVSTSWETHEFPSGTPPWPTCLPSLSSSACSAWRSAVTCCARRA